MQSKRLTLILVVAVAAAVAAWLAARERAPGTSLATGAALVAGLDERVNDVTRVAATGAGGVTLVTLDKGDAAWTVAERGGYRADPAKIRKFLLELADAQLVEQKTAKPENYPALGVEDVSAADATGIEIALTGLGEPARFVLGKTARGGNAVYVRRSDEPTSWVANRRLSFDKTPTGWLDNALIDINAARVQRVDIVQGDGATLSAVRGTVNMEIQDLPQGKAPASPTEANALAGVLDDLRFDDVAPAEGFDFGDAEPVRATYTTSEGLVVEASLYKIGESHHVTLTARAERLSEPAPEPAPPTTDGDAGEATQEPDRPDPDAMLEAMQAEADTLNDRVAGWVYQIPLYKYEQMTHTIDELIE